MRSLILLLILLCLYPGILSGSTSLTITTGISAFANSSSSQQDTARINSLVRAGYHYLGKTDTNIEKADEIIDSALTICKKQKIDIPASLHLLHAEFYSIRGDYSNSEEEAKFARDKAEEEGEFLLMAKSLLFLGGYYLHTGFFQESMDSYNRCIELAKEKGLKGIVTRSLEGETALLETVNDLKGYETKYRMLIQEAQAEHDTTYIELGLLRLGSFYDEKERDFHLADSILRKCIEISLAGNDSYFAAHALANLGWNYYLAENYDSSTAIYKRSLKYSIPGNHYGVSGNSFGNLGTIYRDLGKYDLATQYYLKSIQEAKKINDWYGLSWVYKDMSQLYINTKDTSKAFVYFVLYKQYSDSLLIMHNTQGLADARIRYEADSHKKEVAFLSLKLKNNRILNIGFTVLIILMITIGLLIIRGSKLEAKRRISEMNRRISEITQANLRQQMNPHFIFNTLNSIQYYMYQHDKLATNNYLTKFSSLMRKVLENSHYTSVPLRDELDALNLYLELECLRFKDKFEYRITVDEEIDPLLFKVPTMLIQPYVENSICHGLMPAEGKGFIGIDLKLKKEYILCTIEDNGIGREAAQEKKKKSSDNHNSLGTLITNSRLDLVNALYGTSLKTIYTDLKNEKGEPMGTRVEIHIPIIT
jgi:tetratricopeptide (TPR) repeat protein